MSENSKIEWTDHTFSPWWGCTKVHSGCANCYAETLDARWSGGKDKGHWGKDASRRMILGEWSKPAQWNAAAEKAGLRARVFCASMCDLFEDYEGPVVDQQGKPVCMKGSVVPWTLPRLRGQVWQIIAETPWLEWLLLTKRPENIRNMVPASWMRDARDAWPTNVLTGTSPCDQKTAEKCVPDLLEVPGRHFLSVEPMLGPILVKLRRWHSIYRDEVASRIDWVICGGESGPGARPFDIAWARGLQYQCRNAGVPFFMKQVGSNPRGFAQWNHPNNEGLGIDITGKKLQDPKGGDMSEWPEDLRVREFYR